MTITYNQKSSKRPRVGQNNPTNIINSYGTIVRITSYSEKDLLLTFITQNEGKLSVFARSARTSKRRFLGTPDLFETGTLRYQRNQKNALSTLTEFLPKQIFPFLRSNISKYTSASLICESYSALIHEESETEHHKVFELARCLIQSLELINSATNKDNIQTILIHSLRKLLEGSGFHSFNRRPVDEEVSLQSLLNLVEQYSNRPLLSRTSFGMMPETL